MDGVPERIALEEEVHRARANGSIGERRPCGCRRIDKLGDPGAAIRRAPLPVHRDRHRELEVGAVLQLTLERLVRVVRAIQDAGDRRKDVGRLGGLAFVSRMGRRNSVSCDSSLRPYRPAGEHIRQDNGRPGHCGPVSTQGDPRFCKAGLIGDGCRPQIGLTSAHVSAHRIRETTLGGRQSFRLGINVASFDSKSDAPAYCPGIWLSRCA